MGGNDSCNGKFRYGLKEHSRTTQLVGRICSLQYFIEDYQRIAVFLTFTNKLFQTQQFCIEITYAMSKVIGCAHTTKQREDAHPQPLGENRHTTHGENVVDANSTEESAFACHIGTSHNIIMRIVDAEIVWHSLLS